MLESKYLPLDEYIDMLSRSSNEVHMTNQNSKTGVACWNLSMPTLTCREDAPCRPENGGSCYCEKGRQAFAKNKACRLRNWRILQENREDYWEQVEFRLKHSPLPYFRYNDAGEIPDYQYITEMVELAEKFPDIKFLAYTKMYEMVNQWIYDHGDSADVLPENLCIRFSPWDKDWYVPNPYDLPMAWVDFKRKEINPEFPEKCASCPNQKDKNVKCCGCGICFNKNIHDVKFEQH